MGSPVGILDLGQHGSSCSSKCVCVCVHPHVCVCVHPHVCVCVHPHVCVSAHGEDGSMSSYFLLRFYGT